MAKYYVQSGNLKMVMNSVDAQSAALWLVHKAMKDVLPAYDDLLLTDDERFEIAIVHGLMQLDNTVAVDERGFDRQAQENLDVYQLIESWHALMSALLKMESDLL